MQVMVFLIKEGVGKASFPAICIFILVTTRAFSVFIFLQSTSLFLKLVREAAIE